LIKLRILRKREINVGRVKSLVNSAIENAKVILSIPLNEKSSTIVFREIYECIRQLGEASWRLRGYEPLNHEVSLDGLNDFNVKNKILLNSLSRFKKIRHGANYEGMKISPDSAKDIIEFWKKCGIEITKILINKINH
jgi:hypothetical protein